LDIDLLELLVSALKQIFDRLDLKGELVYAKLHGIVLLLRKVKLAIDLIFNLNNVCVEICETVFKFLKNDWLFPFQAVNLLKPFYPAIGTI